MTNHRWPELRPQPLHELPGQAWLVLSCRLWCKVSKLNERSVLLLDRYVEPLAQHTKSICQLLPHGPRKEPKEEGLSEVLPCESLRVTNPSLRTPPLICLRSQLKGRQSNSIHHTGHPHSIQDLLYISNPIIGLNCC